MSEMIQAIYEGNGLVRLDREPKVWSRRKPYPF